MVYVCSSCRVDYWLLAVGFRWYKMPELSQAKGSRLSVVRGAGPRVKQTRGCNVHHDISIITLSPTSWRHFVDRSSETAIAALVSNVSARRSCDGPLWRRVFQAHAVGGDQCRGKAATRGTSCVRASKLKTKSSREMSGLLCRSFFTCTICRKNNK